jgi:acetylornithine deacetylase
MVQGGSAANIVASSAWFFSDIRAIPSESPWDYVERYRSYARDVLEPRMKAIAPEAGIAIELVSEIPGLRPETDGEAERLTRRITGDNANHVVAYGTEAGLFQGIGWSTVVCGPGDIAQAHQPDEYIEIRELEAGERFLRRLIADVSA